MTATATLSTPVVTRRHPLVRLISSVWFGIVILALILIYGSIISAIAPVRWALEVTEMQAFRHWFFVTLTGLFVISLIAATIVRARWSVANAGVFITHIGLLLLTGGAIAYFGTKIEGDVLLQAPAVYVRVNMSGQSRVIARFPAVPGEGWSQFLPFMNQSITLKVLETQARDGQPVAGVKLLAQMGQAPPQTLTLTDGPDDWPAVDERFAVHLQNSPPQTTFYDDETPVLYITNSASGTDVIKRIRHLPIHREHYLADGPPLKDVLGREVPSRRLRPEIRLGPLAIPTGWFEPWRMPIEVDSEGLPFTIEITGYLPAVRDMQPVRGADGRETLVPVLEAAENRRPDTSPRSMSAIRLKLTGKGAQANWSETQWCLFSVWTDADPRPLEVQVPGVPAPWEIVYSRAQYDLGAALSASRLWVNFFPGQRGVESFHSEFMVQQGHNTPYLTNVSTNQTHTIGHWTLFQSGFDGEDHWRYSILGVGNRIGIWPMNIGWITVATGCLYAFYLKPTLLRRARMRLA